MAALEASSPDDPPLLGPRRADHRHQPQQQPRQQRQRRRRRRRHRQRQRRREGHEEGSDYSSSSSPSSSSSSSWWSSEGESESEAEGARPSHQAVARAVTAASLQFLVALADEVRSLWARQPRRLRIGLAYLLATALLPFVLLPSWREAWARALVIAPPLAGFLLAQWAAGSLLD